MRRMISGPVLFVPNEHNKVFCAQFVADELIANNIKPGIYAIKVTDTQNKIQYPYQLFVVGDETEYHGLSFMDANDYEVAIRFTYNADIQNITFKMYGIGAIANSDYHVDMFQLD